MKRLKDSKTWFTLLFIILNIVLALLYFYQPRFISPSGIILSSALIATTILISYISLKAFIGAILTEALSLMLFVPLLLFLLFLRQPGLIELLKVLSMVWQVWISTQIILGFILFHRHILRITTPFGEIEMKPLVAPEPGIEMPEVKI